MSARVLFFSFLLFSFFICFAEHSIYTDRDYVRIAEFFERGGDQIKAAENYKKALAANQHNVDANLFFAMENKKKGDYAASLKYFQKLVSLNVKNGNIFFNIGVLLHKYLGRVYEAIPQYKKAIALGYRTKDVYFILKNAYLLIGDFEKACKQDEIIDRLLGKKIEKLWDGSHPHGKTILFHSDQGIGDIFMWLRYARDFKKQGANIVAQVRRGVIPLLSNCWYIDKIVPKDETYTDFDFQVPMSKARYLLNNSVESFYTEIPYLYADDSLVLQWAQKLSDDRSFRVGICWDPYTGYVYAKTGEPVKNERAVPLCFFEPLSRIKGVKLYSLQQVNGTEQIKNVSKDCSLHVFNEDFDKTHGSFSDTAAVMKHLDLVITADTSVAHLAGALGVPVWVLVPFYSNWRWLLKRPDTPWYPTMRLFRQDAFGDWESAMGKVYGELVNIVNMD